MTLAQKVLMLIQPLFVECTTSGKTETAEYRYGDQGKQKGNFCTLMI